MSSALRFSTVTFSAESGIWYGNEPGDRRPVPEGSYNPEGSYKVGEE